MNSSFQRLVNSVGQFLSFGILLKAERDGIEMIAPNRGVRRRDVAALADRGASAPS